MMADMDAVVLQWRKSADEWRRAQESWLAGIKSDHTRRAYSYAVKAFFEVAGVPAWLVSGAHVREWQQEMRAGGVAESTINQRLSALSSFYDFCERVYVMKLPDTLREISLSDDNPVRRVKRESVGSYSESIALTTVQMMAMLRACDRLTLAGARNYALLMGYMLTGARSAEIRALRWGDIYKNGDRITFKWAGKRGKNAYEEMPTPVYNAIVAYLKAARRLESIGDDDYIFAPLSDAAQRLPNVGAGDPGPITGARVNQIVKKVARLAGLKSQNIHTHTLRHSAAMMYFELSGRDVRKISELLHHDKAATTLIYLNHLMVKENDMWQEASALLGVTG